MKKNVKVITCAALSMMMANTNMLLYAKEDDSDTTKDETVYAMLHADGSVDEEIVSSWLHNDNGIKDLKETLQMRDVKNVKSDEKPDMKGDTYTWNVKGNDVYYEGNSTKQLPVEVKVTYRLNGKEIKGEDLIGKSGKLELHISMKSTKTKQVSINGKSTNIHPLYIGAGIVDLSTDHFSNVSCENGKILSEGNNQMVGFVTLPGLEDTLKSSGIEKTKELNIQDEYVIKCDTKDFEMGPIMLAITPEVPLDKLKDINSLDDLLNGVDQLSDASAKLADGTGQLSDGTATLNSKVGDMVDSIPALSGGVGDLKKGTAQLKSGSEELSANLKSLNNGLSQAKSGTETLAKATAGLPTMVSSVAELDAGMQQLSNGLQDGNKQLAAIDVNALRATLTNMIALNDKISALSTGIPKLNAAIQNIQTLSNGTTTSGATLSDETAAVQNKVCALASANPTDTDLATTCAQATAAAQKANGISQYAAGASTASQQMSDELADLDIADMKDTLKSLGGMLSQLDTLKTEMANASQGAAKLAAGTGQLKQSSAGLGELTKGINTLDSSMATASGGAHQLYAGSLTLVDGLNSADNGAAKLQHGSTVLSNGASQLHSATSTLADKTKELDSGMQTFKSTGIDKMKNEVDLSMSDVNQLLAIKDELVKEAKQEHTFSGAPEGSDTKVKFIYKTDELKKAKKVDTPKAETKEASKDGFFDKITNFFAKLW